LIAREIKHEIFSRTGGLTASAGVASTKFVAKLASGMNKPDGLTVVRPHEVDALITALPVEAFHGVGPKTAQRLRALGVTTGAELRGLPLSVLVEQFGEKGGTQFWRIARGIDERPVDPSDDRRSVGAEETFDTDVSELAALRQTLEVMATRTSVRLAGQNLAGRTVTLKVKFANFQTVTRRVSLPLPVRAADDVTRVAATLLTPELLSGRAVRLLGVTVSSLERVDDAPGQGFLFPPW
jgi:DNA polymerase-4